MMNHFFTFLFAAYGLAVYGQDNLIGEVYLSFQSSYNTVAIDGCEVGLSYMLQIEGTYGVANGSCNRDAAFGNFGNPTPHCQWVWNDVCDGCQDHRPTPDIYNPDHAYSYPFIAVSSEQTFHFQDLGGAGDNCGGLTMRIFTAGNVGCTSTSACNYDSEAVHDDGSCLYPDACGECEGNGLAGCTDALACNFNEDATCDDGGCDYSCCPGPGCCGEGTAWNWQTSECDIVNPADINLDGCVQLNDLLDLLSAYGDCGAEETPWQCGDALDYQGYNYETVQIGEQCWFAENLRTEEYSNGDFIQSDLADEAWTSTLDGAFAVYGEGATDCEGECDEAQNLALYGGLYNWYATVDERALCPQGWHVPSNDDFMDLVDATGSVTTSGLTLKSNSLDIPPWDGLNSAGFAWNGAGLRRYIGNFWVQGVYGYLWTSDESDADRAYSVRCGTGSDGVDFRDDYKTAGFSVRCLKDAE